jgi:hypothetical protein
MSDTNQESTEPNSIQSARDAALAALRKWHSTLTAQSSLSFEDGENADDELIAAVAALEKLEGEK